MTTVLDQSIYIKESITSLWREGLVGAVFAVLIIWVFLRSWRSTLIAGLSIPLSVIGALALLWWRGESLNMLTLGGLTIAIGRVIDDSIVVIENTHRHLQEGDDIHAAAYTRDARGRRAITASTLTTVAVFLPLGFVHGLASEFFRPFALTVTLRPACQPAGRPDGRAGRLRPSCSPSARWATATPPRSPGCSAATCRCSSSPSATRSSPSSLAVAVFVAAMSLAPLLKTNLFDNSAQNTMTVTQQMPPGTSLDATMAAATKVEEVLAATEGIDIFQVTARQHRQPVRRRRRHRGVLEPGRLHHPDRPRDGQGGDHRGRARRRRPSSRESASSR